MSLRVEISARIGGLDGTAYCEATRAQVFPYIGDAGTEEISGAGALANELLSAVRDDLLVQVATMSRTMNERG